MRCYYHPAIVAIGKCAACGTAVCTHCSLEIDERLLCKNCIVRQMNRNASASPKRSIASTAALLAAAGVIILVLSYLIANYIIAPGLVPRTEAPRTASLSDPIVDKWSGSLNDLFATKTVYFYFFDGGLFYLSYDPSTITQYQGRWVYQGDTSSYYISFGDSPSGPDMLVGIEARYDKNADTLSCDVLSSNRNIRSCVMKRM